MIVVSFKTAASVMENWSLSNLIEYKEVMLEKLKDVERTTFEKEWERTAAIKGVKNKLVAVEEEIKKRQ